MKGKGHLKGRRRVKLRERRKVNEVQFPFSYCILGKGVSPRLLSEDAAAFSTSFPPHLMDAAQSEHAAYFWPRIVAPRKFRRNNLYLHLCLPQSAQTDHDGSSHAVSSPRVVDRLKLNHRQRSSSGKGHVAINAQREGVDEREYGQIQKWLVAKSDNKLQQYQDARRAKWGELWPWPSPEVTRCQSLRADPVAGPQLKALHRFSRPKFRENFTSFKKRCHDFVHHTNNIDLI